MATTIDSSRGDQSYYQKKNKKQPINILPKKKKDGRLQVIVRGNCWELDEKVLGDVLSFFGRDIIESSEATGYF